MTIKNQVGRTSFDMAPPEWVEGLVLEGSALGWPLPYPERRATWEVVFSGTIGDGTFGATLVGPSGELVPIEVEREAGDPATNTLVAAAWAAAVLADADAIDLVHSAEAASGTVTIAFRSPGLTYSITDEVFPDAVAQVSTFTIGQAGDGDYTIPINAEEFTTDGTGNTTTQIRDELVVLINGGAEPVTAAPVSTDQISVTADVAGVAFTHVLTAQIVDFQVVDNDAGDHTITINGTAHTLGVVAETITEIRDDLLGQINAGAQAAAVTATAVSTDTIRVTADVAGTRFTWALVTPSDDIVATVDNGPVSVVATTANVSSEVEATQTQAPNGGAIAFGRFVVKTIIDGKSAVRLPEAGDVAADIVGVTARTHATLPRPANAAIDDEPTYLPGSTLTPIERVDAICLRNIGNVAAVVGGAVYAVVADATDEFGEARADADSGNAVAPSKFTARWLTNTPAGALGLVSLR